MSARVTSVMRPRMPFALVVALAGALLLAGALAGPLRHERSMTPSLEERVHEVAATLRCPVCHDLSAADSPSPVAAEMRRQIARELEAGRTPDEIRGEFLASYGEWILLTPPSAGLAVLPWVAPPALTLVGFVLIALITRRRAQAPAAIALAREERRLLDRALAREDDEGG